MTRYLYNKKHNKFETVFIFTHCAPISNQWKNMIWKQNGSNARVRDEKQHRVEYPCLIWFTMLFSVVVGRTCRQSSCTQWDWASWCTLYQYLSSFLFTISIFFFFFLNRDSSWISRYKHVAITFVQLSTMEPTEKLWTTSNEIELIMLRTGKLHSLIFKWCWFLSSSNWRRDDSFFTIATNAV